MNPQFTNSPIHHSPIHEFTNSPIHEFVQRGALPTQGDPAVREAVRSCGDYFLSFFSFIGLAAGISTFDTVMLLPFTSPVNATLWPA